RLLLGLDHRRVRNDRRSNASVDFEECCLPVRAAVWRCQEPEAECMPQTRAKTPGGRRSEAATTLLDALAEAVESGAGVPEIARAAGAVLDASLALIHARGAVLAVAAGSPSEEKGLLAGEDGVTVIDLRVAEAEVGQLRFRPRSELPEPAVLRMVTTLLALEVERTRAPERASEAAVGGFVNAVLDAQIADKRDLIARGKELGTDL